MDSYRESERLIRADTAIAPHIDTLVGTSLSRGRISAQMILNLIVNSWRNGEDQSEVIDDAWFENAYQRFENYFYSTHLGVQIAILLDGFKASHPDLELDGGYRIGPLDQSWVALQYIKSISFPITGLGIYAIRNLKKMIGDEPVDDTSAKEVRECEEELSNIVNALVIFKKGSFRWAGPFRRETDYFRSITGGNVFSGGQKWWGNFELMETEGPSFSKFWSKARTLLRNGDSLAIAARRFGFAEDRMRPEDELIDLMIAAEALFLSDTDSPRFRTELSFRLCLKAALFLGDNGDEGAKLFRLFRDAYNKRSEIVHGGIAIGRNDQKERAKLCELVEEIREKMRLALKLAIEQSANGTMKKWSIEWESLLWKRWN